MEIMISSPNWTLEPCFYREGKLWICSNSQVHQVRVIEGEFEVLGTERAKGKHVRCITCDHTTIITDQQMLHAHQVVSINNNLRVAANGATLNSGGRDGVQVTAVLYEATKVTVGYDDGYIYQDGQQKAKCVAKVTALCSMGDYILVADLSGTISKFQGQVLEHLMQIPVDQRDNQNLKAYRLAKLKSPDQVDVVIASGDNGALYVVNIEQQEMIKVGDNPHNMPLIQILTDPNNPHQFLTVGYDRVITNWEILPGGIYLEMLGCLHTLGTTANQLQTQGQTLYVPQQHKLLVMNLASLITFDCQLPLNQLLELKVGEVDGLVLLRYQTRVILYMVHTKETIMSFKVADCIDAIFNLSETSQFKYHGVSKESQALMSKQTLSVLALQKTESGCQIVQLAQNNQHKLIRQSSRQLTRLITGQIVCSGDAVILNETEIKGKFVCSSEEVVLVDYKGTLQAFNLISAKMQASYKLSFQITQSCMIPDRNLCAVVTDEGQIRLFDLQKVTLLQCLCSTKLQIRKIVAITATQSQIVFATDDKCIVSKEIVELMQQISQPQTKKRLKQTDESIAEYTLFGIVRSRVFYQQKLEEIQRVTAMLQSGEKGDKIDLKLLRWTEQNREEIVRVVSMEIDSCTRIERFEFYQKVVVLEYWLALIEQREFNKQVFTANRDKFKTENFTLKFEQFLEGNCQEMPLHLQAIQLIKVGNINEAIRIYSDQNFLTEALCFAKAFGDKETFMQVLQQAQLKFSEAKDRQAQAQKLSAALKVLEEAVN